MFSMKVSAFLRHAVAARVHNREFDLPFGVALVRPPGLFLRHSLLPVRRGAVCPERQRGQPGSEKRGAVLRAQPSRLETEPRDDTVHKPYGLRSARRLLREGLNRIR